MINTTMSLAQEEIINAIQSHMSRFGSSPDTWYIGIANNIRKKLFEEHKVSEQNGIWIYRTLENHHLAKEIKKHFVSLGLNSEDSDDEIGNIVFAYQKTSPAN